MRELNRLGLTGPIDAGSGFQNYPEDYAVIQKLSDEGQLTIRLARPSALLFPCWIVRSSLVPSRF
jgi:predicted amidohydrolase YtcJ